MYSICSIDQNDNVNFFTLDGPDWYRGDERGVMLGQDGHLYAVQGHKLLKFSPTGFHLDTFSFPTGTCS